MRRILCLLSLFAVLLAMSGCGSPGNSSENQSGTPAGGGTLMIGIGKVDITPDEPVVIAGSPFPETTSDVSIPLYARAMVIDDGKEKAAVITLDTLKYPTNLAETAMKNIEKETGIPADKITITSSHTHSGPYYPSYGGKLTGMMTEAVKLAMANLEPCEVGAAKTQVTGAAHNRRLLVDGEAWNTWMVTAPQPWNLYEACGPIDPDLQLLAVKKPDGTFKAVLWNYACHASAVGGNGGNSMSADYPGYVEDMLTEQLGYDITALFLPGACGDINPSNSLSQVGKMLGNGILKSLENLEMIAEPSLTFKAEILDLPGRENPTYEEGAAEIEEKWPAILEGYRVNFDSTLAQSQPTYKTYICAFSIGGIFAVVTNPDELFCSIGLNIKAGSPFKYTLVTEQTNGALGYIPAEQDFPLKGYEVWFGEHSICAPQAGTMIQETSIALLGKLPAK